MRFQFELSDLMAANAASKPHFKSIQSSSITISIQLIFFKNLIYFFDARKVNKVVFNVDYKA